MFCDLFMASFVTERIEKLLLIGVVLTKWKQILLNQSKLVSQEKCLGKYKMGKKPYVLK